MHGVGANFNNWGSSDGVANSIALSLGMMFVGSVLLGLLGAYVSGLHPGEHSAASGKGPLRAVIAAVQLLRAPLGGTSTLRMYETITAELLVPCK